MSAFQTVIQIANRACQHIGAPRITALTEDSVQASEINANYDLLRDAEQRRNVWRFSIRKAVLRAIDTDTKIFTPSAWAIGTTYAQGAIVSYANQYWSSGAASNLAHTPGAGDAYWDIYCGPLTASLHDADTSYYAGEIVYISSTAYLSLINTNGDTPPTSNWLTLVGTVAALAFVYPIGAGPASQTGTLNVYRMPNGYLREAPQDPKAGSVSMLGAPSAAAYNDWEFEGDYIITSDVNLIVFRFAASVTSVARMDPMFCEGLGARIGYEICERVTQSNSKQANCAAAYKAFMTEARIVNGIEKGAVEPEEDEYVQCRT